MVSIRCLRRGNLHRLLVGRIGLWTSRKMHKAYFRYVDGSESFQLCVNVKDESVGVDRQFNFSRQATENVSSLLSRINTNLEKVFAKYEKKKKRKQKKEAGSEETGAGSLQISADLLCNGSSVPPDNVCKDVLFGNDELKLIICGKEYEVVVNAPWIDCLTLPTNIMAGFPVYPIKFEHQFSTRNDSLFAWYRKKEDKNSDWEKVGDDYYYNPTADDIGCMLKLTCTPGNATIQGPPYEVIAKNHVQAGPGHCPFELRHSFTNERLEWPNFRVVSYNILADLYADSDVARNQLYPYCPPYALAIDYRKQLFCREIMGYNADIVCLQEVDHKVFLNDLEPFLTCLDYEGVFAKKGGQVSEGLACFYHKSKFRLLNTYTICLADELSDNPIFTDLWEILKDNTNLVTRFKERTTCIMITLLQSTSNENEVFLVGNTHLYFHPNADHIRLLQAGMLVQYMEHLRVNIASTMPGTRLSVIICGDFNSTPECGVYQLMTTQWVPDDLKDWSSHVEEAITNVSLSHTMLLQSACGTPEITNFTVGFFGCLDYIFYQHDNILVSQVVPLPSEEELKEHTALPSVVFPSDHVALVCDLKLVLEKT